jgi:DNA-directed RNA polymerase beta' subunit
MGFFMSHVEEIRHIRNQSEKRDMKIALMDKYRENMIIKHFLVMPAGLRDIQVDAATGRTSEDEVNGMLRGIISTANAISITTASRNDPVLDARVWPCSGKPWRPWSTA